jgi:hypothetical protein
MILDDTAWFAAQKRIRAELAQCQDEWSKIHFAQSVISDHERSVRDDIIAWANKNGMATHTLRHQAKAYWNERLN